MSPSRLSPRKPCTKTTDLLCVAPAYNNTQSFLTYFGTPSSIPLAMGPVGERITNRAAGQRAALLLWSGWAGIRADVRDMNPLANMRASGGEVVVIGGRRELIAELKVR